MRDARIGMQKDTTLPGRDVTRAEAPLGDGEGFGPGVKYTAVLNQRANKSIRNYGPDHPSANNGSVKVVGQDVRKTGAV